MGCKVALLQDRPVLGGNGSSEVRVWAKGGTRRGRFPRLGEIVEEFADRAADSPGTYEEFGDDRKLALVGSERNIDLFLNTRAEDVGMAEDGSHIDWVDAFDTRSGVRSRFAGRLFADCTGHGFVGAWAGAEHTVRSRSIWARATCGAGLRVDGAGGLSGDALGVAAGAGRLPVSAPRQGRVVLGERLRPAPDRRSRGDPRLEPARGVRRVPGDEERAAGRRTSQRRAAVGGLRQRHPRIAAACSAMWC